MFGTFWKTTAWIQILISAPGALTLGLICSESFFVTSASSLGLQSRLHIYTATSQSPAVTFHSQTFFPHGPQLHPTIVRASLSIRASICEHVGMLWTESVHVPKRPTLVWECVSAHGYVWKSSLVSPWVLLLLHEKLVTLPASVHLDCQMFEIK